MLYHSTRNQNLTADSAQAVLEGLAPDGGLYMPAVLPAFDWQKCLSGSAQEMSCMILSALLPEIPNMDTLVKNAYTGKFETEELTPTVSVYLSIETSEARSSSSVSPAGNITCIVSPSR